MLATSLTSASGSNSTRVTEAGSPAPVVTGLSNYSGLLHDGTFRTALFNTFYYTINEVPFSTAVASPRLRRLSGPIIPMKSAPWRVSASEA